MNSTIDPWIQVAGWALVHFVWQGAIVALVTAAALGLLRHASAHARYLVSCAALAAMLVAPLVTVRLLSPSASAGPNRALQLFNVPVEAPGTSDASPVVGEGAPRSQFAFSVEGARVVVNRLLPLVVVLWLVGVALLLVRLAGGWWRVRRLHQAALAMAASCRQRMSDELASRLGLRQAVHVVDSMLVDTPTVLGWLRPVVLLPVAALANLTPGQVEAILAHEVAHIRRHDYLVNLLQTVVETLLFYHPAVWWVSSRIRTEREHCCDEVAVEVCGDAVGYAAALAELETSRTGRPVPSGRAALALAATGGSLLERVRRVLRVPADDRAQPRSQTMPAMVTALLVLLLVAGAAGLGRQPVEASTAIDAEVDRARLLLDAPRGPFLVFRHRDERVIEPPLLPRPPGAGQVVRETVVVRLQRQAAPVQTSSPIVSGTMTDANGEGIPDVVVVLSSVATAADHTERTNSSGRFEFVGLPIGQYLVGATAPGFEPFHDRLTVFSGAKTDLTVTLQIRSVAMNTTVIGPPSPTRGRRPLPSNWICLDGSLGPASGLRGFCGPPSLVQELASGEQMRLEALRKQHAQPAMPTMSSQMNLWYPQDLWDAMIEGSVVIEGRVGTDGVPAGVKSVAPVHPGLAKAALDAVNQWRFEPARLRSVPVEVPLKVTVSFRLHQ